MISQSYLKSILSYDPETGLWTWLVSRGGKAQKGTVAGSIKDYVRLHIDGKMYLSHRLAFLYMTGSFPENVVDHKDRDTTNNRWANLRHATRSENLYNQDKNRKNTSGYKGVSFVNGKWRATIKVDRKQIHLGYFDTPEEAGIAYMMAAKNNHKEYAGGLEWVICSGGSGSR